MRKENTLPATEQEWGNVNSEKKGNGWILAVMVLMLAAIFFVSLLMRKSARTWEAAMTVRPTLTHASGLYSETIRVQFLPGEGTDLAETYYTLDGREPVETDPLFPEEGIRLEAGEECRVVPLKVRSRSRNEWSETIQRDYVLYSGTETLSLPLICISIDPAELYDEETGIMVAGTHVGEMNSETGEIRMANFLMSGKEWVRPAWVTFVLPQGETRFSQTAGLSLSGGTSREYAHPSLKIQADTWNPEAFFPLAITENKKFAHLSRVSEYHDLKLRTGGQDANETNIRSAVISRICEESGYPGYLPEMRAEIWLNGEPYSLCAVQPRYIPSWISRRFSLAEAEKVEIIGESELQCFRENGLEELFAADLNREENRKRLEKRVDMDDYLHYLAIQILSNNVDWPGNNFKMWRYTGREDPANPYTDGRYRCLIYDSDLIWLHEGFLTSVFGDNTLRTIMDGDVMMDGVRGNISYIGHILEASAYRDRFLTIAEELLETAFSPAFLDRVIAEEAERIHVETIRIQGEEAWALRSICIDMLREQALHTRERFEKDMADLCHMTEKKFRMCVENAEGRAIEIGHRILKSGESIHHEFCQDTETVLRAAANPGYELDGWILNGRWLDGDHGEIRIGQEDMTGGTVSIQAVSRRVDAPVVVISGIRDAAAGDWIQIMNAGGASADLGSYLISDSLRLKDGERLPDIQLKGGESIRIGCGRTETAYRVSFNLGRGETLCLWNTKESRLVHQLTVPRMSEQEAYVLEPGGNRYVFEQQ